jgi:hypothetical protein
MGNGGISPCINFSIDRGERLASRLGCFTLRERDSRYPLDKLLRPWAGAEVMNNRKYLPLFGNKPRFPGRAARSLVTTLTGIPRVLNKIKHEITCNLFHKIRSWTLFSSHRYGLEQRFPNWWAETHWWVASPIVLGREKFLKCDFFNYTKIKNRKKLESEKTIQN